MPPHDVRDVIAGAVAILVSLPHAGQPVGDHLGGAVRLVQQLHQRDHHDFVAELAEGFGHDRAQPVVLEQRHQLRRDAEVANL